jgi:hypothetical protein
VRIEAHDRRIGLDLDAALDDHPGRARVEVIPATAVIEQPGEAGRVGAVVEPLAAGFQRTEQFPAMVISNNDYGWLGTAHLSASLLIVVTLGARARAK